MSEQGPLQSYETVSSQDRADRAGAKPKWFTPITVSAMVLGSMFGCCGATTVGGHLVQRAAPAMMQAQAVDDNDVALQQFNQRNAAFRARVFPYALTAGTLGLLHSLALVIAGVLAYQRRAIGRKLLVLVFMVGLGIEIISSGVGLYVAKQTGAFTADLMKASIAAGQSQSAADAERRQVNAEKAASMFSSVATVMGIVFLMGMFAIKTGYYIASTLYLRRDAVVQFFERAPPR